MIYSDTKYAFISEALFLFTIKYSIQSDTTSTLVYVIQQLINHIFDIFDSKLWIASIKHKYSTDNA